MISVICACNDEATFNKMLLPSLKIQSEDWELVLIDAKKEGFTSAAQALNAGAARAVGEILFFAHQDVEFTDDKFFEKITEYCNGYQFGIAGVAGVAGNRGKVYSSVINGAKRKQAGKKITMPTEAYTLDECMFFIKRENFKGFEDYGNTWHFYAVEYSLRCLADSQKVIIFPLEIYHLSAGLSLNKSYWQTLKKVAARYKGKFKTIPTTIGVFKNNFLLPVEIFFRKIGVSIMFGFCKLFKIKL